jgi:hypothetical protein
MPTTCKATRRTGGAHKTPSVQNWPPPVLPAAASAISGYLACEPNELKNLGPGDPIPVTVS